MKHFSASSALRRSLLSLAIFASGVPAMAQEAAPDPEVLRQIGQLREQQAQLARMQQENEQALRALEARLNLPAQAPSGPPAAVPPAAPAAPVAAAAAVPPPAAGPRLKVSGDLRLRSQFDGSDDDGRDRSSAQIRARLGATYALNERVTIGGRLATGDADDPNSTDVQISNWNDDLQVSLDLAYAQLDFGETKVYGGKLPMPFARTDLVWDGDVNPQGAAATWKHALGGGGSILGNALFFLVDEQAVAADTTMGGVQFGYASPSSGGFRYDIAGAYYRYSLGGMAGADAGDWRSNRLRPDGTYLSDFRLLDVLASGTWNGPGEKWPVRVVADYVRNLGAVDDQDTGYGVDLSIGRAGAPGDWRFTYGYSRTDVDAVLAAFSHDNIGIGTNYRLHAFTAEYVPLPRTSLGAIWYHYRPNAAAWAGANAPDDWLDRFRV